MVICLFGTFITQLKLSFTLSKLLGTLTFLDLILLPVVVFQNLHCSWSKKTFGTQMQYHLRLRCFSSSLQWQQHRPVRLVGVPCASWVIHSCHVLFCAHSWPPPSRVVYHIHLLINLPPLYSCHLPCQFQNCLFNFGTDIMVSKRHYQNLFLL